MKLSYLFMILVITLSAGCVSNSQRWATITRPLEALKGTGGKPDVVKEYGAPFTKLTTERRFRVEGDSEWTTLELETWEYRLNPTSKMIDGVEVVQFDRLRIRFDESGMINGWETTLSSERVGDLPEEESQIRE